MAIKQQKDVKASKVLKDAQLSKVLKNEVPCAQYADLTLKEAETITARDLVSKKVMGKNWSTMGESASQRCIQRLSAGAEAPVSGEDFYITFGPMVAFKYQTTKHLRKDWRHAIVCQRSLA